MVAFWSALTESVRPPDTESQSLKNLDSLVTDPTMELDSVESVVESISTEDRSTETKSAPLSTVVDTTPPSEISDTVASITGAPISKKLDTDENAELAIPEAESTVRSESAKLEDADEESKVESCEERDGDGEAVSSTELLTREQLIALFRSVSPVPPGSLTTVGMVSLAQSTHTLSQFQSTCR